MSTLIWIKNESSVLIMICFLSFCMPSQFKINFKILFFIIFSIILLNKFLLFNYFDFPHNVQSGSYENLKIENFFDFINIKSFLLITKYLIYGFFEIPSYFLSIVFLIIILKINKINYFNNFLLYSFIFSTIFLYVAFLFNSNPLEWLLNASLNRIMLQTSGFFIIVIPLFYDSFLKKYIQQKFY